MLCLQKISRGEVTLHSASKEHISLESSCVFKQPHPSSLEEKPGNAGKKTSSQRTCETPIEFDSSSKISLSSLIKLIYDAFKISLSFYPK